MAAKPRVVDARGGVARAVASRVKQVVVKLPRGERDLYVAFFLRHNPGRTLVFVNYVSVLRRLAAVLRALGVQAHPLHARMQQRARLKALDRFRAEPHAGLICSDVAARGLDLPGVASVLHFDVPPNPDTYTHRAGRAAHQPGAPRGFSVLLVDDADRAAWARAEAATRGMHGALQLRAHSAQYGAPALARAVAAAQRLMALRFEAERSRSSAAWRKRAAEAAEVVEEEESSAEGGGARGGARSAASGGEQALVARLDALRAELGGSLRLAETAPAPSQRGLSGAAETSQPRVPSGGKDPSPGAPKGMAVVGGRAQLAGMDEDAAAKAKEALRRERTRAKRLERQLEVAQVSFPPPTPLTAVGPRLGCPAARAAPCGRGV